MERNAELYRDNMRINENVLHLCWVHRVKKVVSVLSTCIFPDGIENITEEMIHNGPPHKSNFGYAFAKRMVDVMSRAYREQYGCHFITVIPTNIFGPWDNFNVDTGHVIPSLIQKCDAATRGSGTFVAAGSGRPLRQFIYSKDLARLIVWALRSYDESEPIILCGDGVGGPENGPENGAENGASGELSIRDVAEAIAQIMGYRRDIVWDTGRADGQYRKPALNTKLR
ncbi:hypothetical protein HK102_005790, partial [Quaeritorhiza haematococci]